MRQKLIFSLLALIFVGTSAWAQKPKNNTTTTTTGQSKSEKMGYARTNKYWGPGTFYLYAPGKPNNKMANNKESAMRDLTGISADDFYKEIDKQGFVAVPPKEVKKWFNDNNSKDKKFYYAPDKSYILFPGIKTMDRSPAAENGYGALASGSVSRYVLIPLGDSLKVMDSIWQYLRDLNEIKAVLVSLDSKYKKSKSDVYPFEQANAFGWSNFRAGAWVQVMVDGKPKNYWERHENILRRTIGKPDFDLWIHGMETDFWYGMHVTLQKEGYILNYTVIASTMADLEPGNNWTKEHILKVKEYNVYVNNYKHDIDQYKGKLPPNIEDLNKLLHIK